MPSAMLMFILIVTSYLIGAIPFGLLVARLYGLPDIRKEGSGNIGATNVWRVLGGLAAIWVFTGDIIKGAAAVWMALYFFDAPGLSGELLVVSCAAAAVLGHLFPVYLKFKGGKGVNTTLGAMMAMLPMECLVAVAVFLVVASISRYVSLGSMTAAFSLALMTTVEKFVLRKEIPDLYLAVTILLVLLIIVAHRQNIRRLLDGTENRFSFSSSSNKAGSGA